MDTRILRDDLCNTRRHQCDSAVEVILPEQRNGFASDCADFPIWQNRFQPVANFDPVTMILCRQQDQHALVCGFAADAPFVEEIDRIAFDVGSVERLNSDDGNLRMRLLVDLLTNIVELRDGVLIKDVSKVVDVIRGFQLRYGLGMKNKRQRKH